MLFKLLIRVSATLLVLATLAPAVSAAPADRATPAAVPTPASSSEAPPPTIDPSQLPPKIQAAKALRESLSDTQRKALITIVDGHKSALDSAKAAFDGARAAQTGGAPVDAASVRQAHVTTRSVLASLESEVSNVLDADQKSQFEARRANLPKRPTVNDVSTAEADGASDAAVSFNGPNQPYTGIDQSTDGIYFQPANPPDTACQYAPTDQFFSQSPGDFGCAVQAADEAYEFSYYNYLTYGRGQSLGSLLWSYWTVFYANAAFSNVLVAPVNAELNYQSAYFAAGTACLYADADLETFTLTDYELFADSLAKVFIANSFADLTGTQPVFTLRRFGGGGGAC